MDELAERKRALRRAVRERRSKLRPEMRTEAGAALSLHLQRLVSKLQARTVTCYLAIRNEPETTEFLSWASAQGIDTLLPSAREDGLLDWVRPSSEGFVRGAFGTNEPIGEMLGPLASSEADLMIIPAASVDMQGNRLGWGRGFYDRNLASMQLRPPVYAVVYDDELVDELPAEPHDEPVAGVVTPQRIIHF